MKHGAPTVVAWLPASLATWMASAPPQLETVASLLTLWSIATSARARVRTWPIGLLAVLAYAVVFWQARLYADLGLQGIYFVQGCWGWLVWARSRRTAAPTVGDLAQVRTLTPRQRLGLAAVLLVGSGGIGAALATWTDAAAPYWDATCSVLSLVANTLLAAAVWESWPLWVLADALYIGLFAQKGLWWSVLTYTVALGMAAHGWWRWTRATVAVMGGTQRDADVRGVAA